MNLDSLRNVWNNQSLPDTVRLEAHILLIQYGYAYTQPDSAKIMAKENYALAKTTNSHKAKANILNALGILHHQTGDCESGVAYYQMAKEEFRLDGNNGGVLGVMGNIARCLKVTGQKQAAVEEVREILRIAKEVGNLRSQQYSMYFLGSNYLEEDMAEQAMDAFSKAVDLAEELNDKELMVNPYFSMGILERKAKHFDKAEEYFRYNENIGKELDDLYTLLYYHNNMGILRSDMKDSVSAINHFNQAIQFADSLGFVNDKIAVIDEMIQFYKNWNDEASARTYMDDFLQLSQEQNNTQELMKAHLYLGQYAILEKDFQSANRYCNISYEMAIQDDYNAVVRDACECLYQSYKGLGDTQQALWALEQNMTIKDTLFNEELIRSYTKLTLENEFEKERNAVKIAHEADLERQAMIQKGLIGGAILFGLIAFLMYRSYRMKNRANQILEQKNQMIENQKTQLESLNHTKDRIFAVLGHDMRKPALAFRGIARKVNYLLEKKDYNTLEELGESIERSALGLNTLTDNLLNWALTQKNALPYQPEEIEMDEVIEEVFLTLGRLAEDKEIRLISEVKEGTLVLADRNSLLTIIRNLVDNAIKFTPNGGSIQVRTIPSGRGINVEIIDSGVGMSDEKMKTLFLLQKNKSTKGTSGEKGTGLGLHLVHELIKMNKGDISVDSKQGKGTTFSINLKAA